MFGHSDLQCIEQLIKHTVRYKHDYLYSDTQQETSFLCRLPIVNMPKYTQLHGQYDYDDILMLFTHNIRVCVSSSFIILRTVWCEDICINLQQLFPQRAMAVPPLCCHSTFPNTMSCPYWAIHVWRVKKVFVCSEYIDLGGTSFLFQY